MILRSGEWKPMHLVEVDPGEVNTAYLCDSRGHAERLAEEYAAGRPGSTPSVVLAYIRVDIVTPAAPKPTLLGDWLDARRRTKKGIPK